MFYYLFILYYLYIYYCNTHLINNVINEASHWNRNVEQSWSLNPLLTLKATAVPQENQIQV